MQFASAEVQCVERRLVFGSIPLNMTTTRLAMLSNEGDHHAYFYIENARPLPGMTIHPTSGIIPVGGVTPLSVHLTPSEAFKFDSALELQYRDTGAHVKTLAIRMGGQVEAPQVDIDLPRLDFGGVYTGSRHALPFSLANLLQSSVKVTFLLARYRDFSFRLADEQDPDTNQGMCFTVQLYFLRVFESASVLNCGYTSIRM